MAKLRKMMGELDDPAIIGLMALIETQSKETLSKWAIDYVKAHYLSIYENLTNDNTLSEAIKICESYLANETKLADVKLVIKQARAVAQSCKDPIAQASARAISTAMGVITTPTNGLGFTFYGACCMAYHQAGLKEEQEVYNQIASKELMNIYESLKDVAIENEPHPVKIKWNC